MKNTNITCRDALIKHFKQRKMMITADTLKSHDNFKFWTIKTIKTNLSQLKNEKFLVIGLRSKGSWEKHKFVDKVNNEGDTVRRKIGTGKYYPGKCYYKLKD